MTGTFDVLQRCFAGLELRDDVLWLNPFWSRSLGTLEFVIFYRDHVITLSIAGHAMRVSRGPGSYPPARVGSRGERRDLTPGQTLEFSL